MHLNLGYQAWIVYLWYTSGIDENHCEFWLKANSKSQIQSLKAQKSWSDPVNSHPASLACLVFHAEHHARNRSLVNQNHIFMKSWATWCLLCGLLFSFSKQFLFHWVLKTSFTPQRLSHPTSNSKHPRTVPGNVVRTIEVQGQTTLRSQDTYTKILSEVPPNSFLGKKHPQQTRTDHTRTHKKKNVVCSTVKLCQALSSWLQKEASWPWLSWVEACTGKGQGVLNMAEALSASPVFKALPRTNIPDFPSYPKSEGMRKNFKFKKISKKGFKQSISVFHSMSSMSTWKCFTRASC